MNTIDLTNKRDFAFSTSAMKFIQDATANLEKIAAFGGTDFILSGCVDSGASTTSGFIVLNGIVMPFIGGANQTNIKIVETVTNIVVGALDRDETTFHAEFGDTAVPGYQFAWATVTTKRFVDLVTLTKDSGWLNCQALGTLTNFNVKARQKNGFVTISGSMNIDGPPSVEIFELPVDITPPGLNIYVMAHSADGSELIPLKVRDSGVVEFTSGLWVASINDIYFTITYPV